MRPEINLQPVEPETAIEANQALIGASLADAPRARGCRCLVTSFGRFPGLTPTPWVFRGLQAGIDALGFGRPCVEGLGPDPQIDTLARAWGGDRQASGRPSPRRLGLAVPGVPRPVLIPRAWVGENLVILAPLCHRRTARGAWMGPTASALLEVAKACRVDGTPEARLRAAVRVLTDATASATVVLDGTWWAAVDPQGLPRHEPLAVEHCLSTRSVDSVPAVQAIDAWISSLLLHTPGPGAPAGNVPLVRGRRGTWPRTRLPSTGPVGMAGRAVESLWRRTKTLRQAQPTARLHPVVPGRFAANWSSSWTRLPTREVP